MAGNRPLMQAMASQQKTLEDVRARHLALAKRNSSLERENAILGLQLAYVARLAGVTKELDAIRRQADIENPAQPVPNPGSQPATESTEEAMAPAAYDNPNSIGQTPGATQGVPAAATDVPMTPGESLPTAPFNNLTDVSAPVAGTETQLPLNQTRIETDVRVGDPMNPETAFPLNPAFGPSQQQGTTPPAQGEMNQTAGRNRTLASLRLARLRVAAGLAHGDDLVVAATIEQDRTNMPDSSIRHEIATLSQVVKAASKQSRPAGLVPRAASSAQGVQRTMPSLVTQPAPITSVAGAVGMSDDDAESLFD